MRVRYLCHFNSAKTGASNTSVSSFIALRSFLSLRGALGCACTVTMDSRTQSPCRMHNCQTMQRFSRAVLALALAVCGAAMPVSSPPRRLHTVSGVSSGGDMAMIHAVAYSESILGVAVVAGAPYGCNAIVHPGREVPLCHTAPRHFSSLPVASTYALASLAVFL